MITNNVTKNFFSSLIVLNQVEYSVKQIADSMIHLLVRFHVFFCLFFL